MKTGKVSNPNGGWDDVMDYEVPPKPTNQQTRRALNGWKPTDPEKKIDFGSSKPRALSDLFNKKELKPNQAKLRSRSAGRPLKERTPVVSRYICYSQEFHYNLNILASYKERSISPADVRHGKFKGALGDCFQTGLRPSQDHLNPTGSGHAVATPTQRYICVCIIS